MGDFHFFDLPVYRLTADDFHKQRALQVDKWMYPPDGMFSERNRVEDRAHPDRVRDRKIRLSELYGNWQFNEVIGYIRLYFCGDQVRGMYYAVNRKRMVKTDRKRFVHLTDKLVSEINIRRPSGHDQIREAVDEYIRRCRKRLPMRHIDTSVFDNIAEHMDWPEIMARASFSRSA